MNTGSFVFYTVERKEVNIGLWAYQIAHGEIHPLCIFFSVVYVANRHVHKFQLSILTTNKYFKITLTEGAVDLPTENNAPCKVYWLDENSKHNKF